LLQREFIIGVRRELGARDASESITFRDNLRENRIWQRLHWTLADDRGTRAKPGRHREKATGATPGYVK
jgi:hypothetical protein